jgi:ribosomal protein L7/L12
MVQVRWNGIRPSPKKAIQYLSRHLRVAAADSTKVDLTPRSNPGPGEEDAKILKLARSGDRIGAVNLARRIYGSTLTEAVAFVEKLQSGD